MQVNNNILKKIIAIILIILISLIIFKPKQESEVEVYESKSQNKQFAMYIEKGNDYEIYNEKQFPNQYRYVLNEEKSYCQDNKGNKVNNLISSNYNGSITVTSNKTVFCYLYFDEEFRGTGLELPKSNSRGLSTEVKGDMYRYQGQQSDGIDNYICFGTYNEEECLKNEDKYMYRIIGVEESGRIKVIKKEIVTQMGWATHDDEDVRFPDSDVYEKLLGEKFLSNKSLVPDGWEDKIDNNRWTYGDMHNASTVGARQTGEELYLVETGQKGTTWDDFATENDPGRQPVLITNESSQYYGRTFYYIRQENKKWTNTFESKIALMYLHDYYLAVSDTANCQIADNSYADCKTSWINLAQNQISLGIFNEMTIARSGWNPWEGRFYLLFINGNGGINGTSIQDWLYARPVFYLKSGIYFEGKGTENEPFVIKN